MLIIITVLLALILITLLRGWGVVLAAIIGLMLFANYETSVLSYFTAEGIAVSVLVLFLFGLLGSKFYTNMSEAHPRVCAWLAWPLAALTAIVLLFGDGAFWSADSLLLIAGSLVFYIVVSPVVCGVAWLGKRGTKTPARLNGEKESASDARIRKAKAEIGIGYRPMVVSP